jgi:hypothetical protein
MGDEGKARAGLISRLRTPWPPTSIPPEVAVIGAFLLVQGASEIVAGIAYWLGQSGTYSGAGALWGALAMLLGLLYQLALVVVGTSLLLRLRWARAAALVVLVLTLVLSLLATVGGLSSALAFLLRGSGAQALGALATGLGALLNAALYCVLIRVLAAKRPRTSDTGES